MSRDLISQSIANTCHLSFLKALSCRVQGLSSKSRIPSREFKTEKQENIEIRKKTMASDTNKTNGSKGGGGGFRAKLDHYLYSGEKKHVIAGIAIISVIFGVPWYLMNKGSKHQSHQDYMERADKARKERLSKG